MKKRKAREVKLFQDALGDWYVCQSTRCKELVPHVLYRQVLKPRPKKRKK